MKIEPTLILQKMGVGRPRLLSTAILKYATVHWIPAPPNPWHVPTRANIHDSITTLEMINTSPPLTIKLHRYRYSTPAIVSKNSVKNVKFN